jgi:S1-C subfamily serine protease
MDKVTVSSDEVAGVRLSPVDGEVTALRPVIPFWQKLVLAPLALCLPLICLFTLGIRLACRNKAPRTQNAWVGYCATLLIMSGLASSIAFSLLLLISHPKISEAPGALSIDALSSFPVLPSGSPLSTTELAAKLKPLVCIVVVAPAGVPVSRRDIGLLPFGTAALLAANAEGLLFVTCRHVIDGENWQSASRYSGRVALFGEDGGYAWADVVGRNKNADIALLWTPRVSGSAGFVQPLRAFDAVAVGEDIMTIGHPEGLFFSVGSGLVSRKLDNGIFQISAPVSPGASGGPVYDAQGYLLGIVTSMLDKEENPDAENLNFATCADALTDSSHWLFEKNGEACLQQFRGRQPSISGEAGSAPQRSPENSSHP